MFFHPDLEQQRYWNTILALATLRSKQQVAITHALRYRNREGDSVDGLMSTLQDMVGENVEQWQNIRDEPYG